MARAASDCGVCGPVVQCHLQQLDTALPTASYGNVLWLSSEVACHAKYSLAIADDDHGQT
jgi:hypothetical protein